MTCGGWNVAFRPARCPRHVFAFGYDGEGKIWVVVDPCRRRIAIRTLTPPQFDRWRAEETADCDVLRMETRNETSVLSPGLWCVGTVKRLLGLRSGAFSPGGLRRDMLRAGATRVQIVHEGIRPRRGS